jgi:hypothetical protein
VRERGGKRRRDERLLNIYKLHQNFTFQIKISNFTLQWPLLTIHIFILFLPFFLSLLLCGASPLIRTILREWKR